MTKRTHPLENLSDPMPARIAATLVAVAAAICIFLLLLEVAPPSGWNPAEDNIIELRVSQYAQALLWEWSGLPSTSSISGIVAWPMAALTGPIRVLMRLGVLAQVLVLALTALLAAWAIGRDVHRSIIRNQPRVRTVTTVMGSEPRYGGYGRAVVEEAWKERRLVEGKGIQFAPGIVMPRDVETEHVAIMGTTGSGKSTILEGLTRQGIRRGDRALLIDVKGRLGQRFGLANLAEISLSETDGSTVWRIGVDIRNRQDAIEFSAVLIQASRDPIWSDGARLYLTGLVVALQRKYGTKWGWRHLQEFLGLPFTQQEQLIRQSMPDVSALLQMKDGDPTATVMSILVTVVANVGSLVWTMAERERAGGTYFSLRVWAAGRSRTQVVVLRLEYDRETQSAALLKLALRCVQSTLLGTQVADGQDNAIWFGLDELPRFCDAQTVERLVALGRSRGIRIIAALQTPAQLRREIGRDAATALLGNFGIQIISRMAPGPDRKDVSDHWLGTRTVTWTDPATEKGPGAVQTKDIAVLSEGELTGVLGKFYRINQRPFIRAAVTGFEHVPILDWPLGWAERL